MERQNKPNNKMRLFFSRKCLYLIQDVSELFSNFVFEVYRLYFKTEEIDWKCELGIIMKCIGTNNIVHFPFLYPNNAEITGKQREIKQLILTQINIWTIFGQIICIKIKFSYV